MKQIIGGLFLLLVSATTMASVSALAVVNKAESNDSDIVIPMTLNNQGNSEISTENVLVPAYARSLQQHGEANFDISVPAREGVHTIRYTNKSGFGCDFRVFVQAKAVVVGPNPVVSFDTFVAATAVDTSTSCSVSTVGNYNVLAVGVTDILMP